MAAAVTLHFQPVAAGVVFKESRGAKCGAVDIAVSATNFVVSRERLGKCIAISVAGAAVSDDLGSDSYELRNIYRELREVVLFGDRIRTYHIRAFSFLFAAVGKNRIEAREIGSTVRNVMKDKLRDVDRCLRGDFFRDRSNSRGRTTGVNPTPALECRILDRRDNQNRNENGLNTVRFTLTMGPEVLVAYFPTRLRR